MFNLRQCDLFEASLTKENKELMKHTKDELIDMFIKNKYTPEELEAIEKNEFNKFLLNDEKQEIKRMGKTEIIFRLFQNGEIATNQE